MTGRPRACPLLVYSNMHGSNYQVETWEGARIIKTTGHIDAISFSDLASVIIRLMLESTPCLVLDCSGVTYIESAQLIHLGELAQAARNRGGDLICIGFCPAILSVAQIIKATDSLKCPATLAEALYVFSSAPAAA